MVSIARPAGFGPKIIDVAYAESLTWNGMLDELKIDADSGDVVLSEIKAWMQKCALSGNASELFNWDIKDEFKKTKTFYLTSYRKTLAKQANKYISHYLNDLNDRRLISVCIENLLNSITNENNEYKNVEYIRTSAKYQNIDTPRLLGISINVKAKVIQQRFNRKCSQTTISVKICAENFETFNENHFYTKFKRMFKSIDVQYGIRNVDDAFNYYNNYTNASDTPAMT